MPEPPGRTGLPLIGETLEFLRDSYGFTARRTERYGPVFQTSILGKRRVIMSGPEACARWIDPVLIRRADSMPGPLYEVFGGISLPSLDGSAHALRKRQVVAALTPGRLASYLPDLQLLIGRFLADAADRPEPLEAVDTLRELSITCLCKNIMGLDPGPDIDALLADYRQVLALAEGVPLDLPGTALRRAKTARDRILDRLGGLIAARRDQPGGDGLSAILAAAPEGETIDDAACRLELHHLVLAGYIIFGELVGALLQLDRHPEVKRRLAGEVDGLVAGPLGVEAFATLPYLSQVVLELKRHTPVVNTFFGVARRAFDVYGYRVPEGRSVVLSLTDSNRSKEVWTEPDRFDPERFAPERAEHQRHEHAFVVHGPGSVMQSHACAGQEYTTVVMSVFLVELLLGYDWSLPDQDLSYDFRKIPAEPRDGLRVQFRRR